MSIVLCIVSKENQLISISRSKITQNIRNMQENYDFCMNFYDFWSKVVQKKSVTRTLMGNENTICFIVLHS